MLRRTVISLPVALMGAPRFTEELWRSIAGIYARTLRHPFLRGLGDGTLPPARFRFFLIQDALYLNAFSRAARIVAAKAPRGDWTASINKDADEALYTEQLLHREVLGSHGVTPDRMAGAQMAPVNYAYSNHLLVTAAQASFAEGIAAMLPCYWIYWEVGKELKKRGSRNAAYQRWIDQYAGEDFGNTVNRMLLIMDDAAGSAPKDRLKQLFVTSARYEYQFWDMAWREEKWTPA